MTHKTVIYALCFALGILGALQIIHVRDDWKEKTVKHEYADMFGYPNIENSSCVNQKLGFEVKIRQKNLEGDTVGMWVPDLNTIYLEKVELDMDTISHEVYHMTQTMGERYHLFGDEEYLAYMQGFFTDCVAKVVANSLEAHD